ncbi:oligosaccharyltransferase 48 kDa subunit beta domain-containing protein [Phanerochaete sordida]|uniref:Dolichyl-diphosphooligosaccharide--protein glycosyltransferase subunit WBP1 n=1 Tax=Phanerochaete sordida TaxID=48140 RepID=A0A9P3G4C2_9APHY|nr:oligosaccharyltransferase 48 kDa subunit beta domain-containing protein [Phanerochaete sordida]
MLLRRAAALLALVLTACARSSTGDSVLVVLDPSLDKDAYSTFWAGLTDKGYNLTFRTAKEAQPEIIQDEVAQFSHVVVFAPESKNLAQDLTPQALVSLLDKGTNLLLALSPSKQTTINTLASEFSLVLPPPGTPLISHFPARDAPATVVPVSPPAAHPVLSSGLPPVWFSGVPFAYTPNPLLIPILSAPAESFAADTSSDSGADAVFESADRAGEGLWAGSSLSLVAGFQATTGARVTFVGGVETFSDEFAQKELPQGKSSGNKQFAEDVAGWTFQETNALRIDKVEHHRVNETEPREMYTTNDNVVFTLHVSKFNPIKDTWEPYSGIKDMQLEFTMLDPHIRTSLPPIPGKAGEYSVAFRVPDRHGVFKFVVNHKRKGWTHLESTTVVPVVPPRHDEYPRFLSAAWPYYIGAMSTSAAFVLFVALWLSGDDREGRKKGLKTE